MNFATIGASIWGVLKKTPDWLIWLAVGLLFWKWTDWSAERRGAQKAEEKFDKEAREVESEVITNITENTDAVIRESDAVRSRPAVVELPDGTQGLPEYHYRD